MTGASSSSSSAPASKANLGRRNRRAAPCARRREREHQGHQEAHGLLPGRSVVAAVAPRVEPNQTAPYRIGRRVLALARRADKPCDSGTTNVPIDGLWCGFWCGAPESKRPRPRARPFRTSRDHWLRKRGLEPPRVLPHRNLNRVPDAQVLGMHGTALPGLAIPGRFVASFGWSPPVRRCLQHLPRRLDVAVHVAARGREVLVPGQVRRWTSGPSLTPRGA